MFSQRFCKVCHGGGEMAAGNFCFEEALFDGLVEEIIVAPIDSIVAIDGPGCLIEFRGRLMDSVEGLSFGSRSLVSVLFRYMHIFHFFPSDDFKQSGNRVGTLRDFGRAIGIAKETILSSSSAENLVSEIAGRMNERGGGLRDCLDRELGLSMDNAEPYCYFCSLVRLAYAILKARHSINFVCSDSEEVPEHLVMHEDR